MKLFSKYSNEKLKAFTLFESVVAISIITVLIGLGSMIYGNVMQAEKPMAYYQAQDQIDQHFQELCETKAFFNRDFELENYQIEQRVSFYNGNEKLYQVAYTVRIAGEKLLTENHLVVNDLNE
jgi:type II secretory pathway component PulJ